LAVVEVVGGLLDLPQRRLDLRRGQAGEGGVEQGARLLDPERLGRQALVAADEAVQEYGAPGVLVPGDAVGVGGGAGGPPGGGGGWGVGGWGPPRSVLMMAAMSPAPVRLKISLTTRASRRLRWQAWIIGATGGRFCQRLRTVWARTRRTPRVPWKVSTRASF